MASEYITDYLTLNVAPTTIFQATNNISYIIAKVLLKNEKSESSKVTIKLNNLEVVKDLILPIFSEEPIELNSISKLRLKGTDKLEITVTPDSFTGVAGGTIGAFPWITQVEANAATIILNYVKTTI
jgi:hypothetical protein